MSAANVVLITVHDLGRMLGCYGQRTVHTPALDRFAADGVMADNAFCAAPLCSPSRAALHTGRYPHATGVLGLTHNDFGWRLDPPTDHIAHRMRNNGYRTVLAGLQHVTDDAHRLGFDETHPRGPIGDLAPRSAAVISELADAGAPFYLEIGIFEPHRPWDHGGVVPDRSLGIEVPHYLPDTAGVQQDLAALQGAIRAMDRGVGEILAALESTGLASNTLVIFTTDHGLALPRAKSTLYDPGIEGALILRWPSAGLGGGRVTSELISNVDLVPTILDALSLPKDRTQGTSILPILHNDAAGRQHIYAEKTYHTGYEPMRAVRSHDHKLIVNFEAGPTVDVPSDIREGAAYPDVAAAHGRLRPHIELYDLHEDPGEMANLAGQHGSADLEAELLIRLSDWMRHTHDPLLDGPIASPFNTASMTLLNSAAVRV